VREQQQLSVFNKIILWINYFVIIALLTAVISKYISPLLFWLPAFFGLAFPFLFLLNALFVIYWFVQFKHAFIFGLIALVLSVTTAYRYVQFSSDTSANTKTLKVTSYNCMLFDLYNWTKNKEARNNILTSLSDINPDILCLQEFYTSEEKGDYDNIDTLKKLFNTKNYHVEFTTTLRGLDHWGIATFSKYPIVNQGKLMFNTRANNICIFTDIVVNKDTLRVYNLHLQSISFSKQDNKFLEDVISDKDAEDEVTQSKNILRRLKRAFVKRTRQVEMIALHMRTCRYKIILCGDFNDTPASYAYQKLSYNLRDAFIEKGRGFGKTYAGKWPQFRIDYILHSKELKCVKYRRCDETFTDHYPITAFFEQ
jgi:endonuclease/exonuclease/phosphatase family metal-dependent hydrolase